MAACMVAFWALRSIDMIDSNSKPLGLIQLAQTPDRY